MNNKKLLTTVVAALAVLAIGWYGVTSLASKSTLELSGLVQAREVKNAPRFGGRVQKILVQEGDVVKAGEPLLQFDDIELKAKIAEAHAALSQARAQKSLVAKGVDVADLQAARAQWQQAEENVRQLSEGALEGNISQARAKFESAEGMLKQAKSQYANADRLLDEGIISQQKYQQLQSAYETAQSNYNAAKSALSLAEAGSPEQLKIARAQQDAAKARYNQLRRGARPEEVDIALANIEKAQSAVDALEAQQRELTLKAPIDGTVSVISVAEGELIQPGKPVISIIDYSQLWADIFVPETQLDFVRVGQDVNVKAAAYKNAVFTGRVALLSQKSEFMPNASGTTATDQNTFRVKVDIENRDQSGNIKLLPGMKVNVTLNR